MQALVGVALFWALLWGVGYVMPRIGISVLPVSIVSLLVVTAFFVLSRSIRDFFTPAADLLIQYMPLFFIPVVVGVMVQKQVLSEHWVLLFFVIVGATVISLLSSAFIYTFFKSNDSGDAPVDEDAK